jgi:hypothetical protein
VLVVGVKPLAGFCIIAADECVEGSIESKKKKSELAFGSLRLKASAALQARYECFARTDYLSELLVAKLESLCCG